MKILIEAFSAPGCAKCAQTRQALKAVAEELGKERFVWRDVNVLEEMDYAVELGVMTPPSLAIDGELVFPALPTPERLRVELAKRLGRANGH
jgi:thiol-disulfide isomerase/thioredoxin